MASTFLFLLLISTPASAGVFNGFFSRIITDDIDIKAVGTFMPLSGMTDCNSQCVIAGDSCVATSSEHDRCYLIFRRTTKNWSEKSVGNVTLMVRQGGQDPNCSDSMFPIQRGRSRYRFQKTITKWKQAKTYCESLGAKLLQITSHAEQKMIKDVIRDSPRTIMVGAKRTPSWRWQPSGDRMLLTDMWLSGQPNNYGGYQPYTVIYRSGFMNDVSSTWSGYILCECLIV